MFKLLNIKKLLAIFAIALFVTASVYTQTTTFTYQGRLTDSTVPSPTNGTYEMRFRVYDAVSGGNQFPVTVTLPTVQVTNGIFTVQLDFGSAAFSGQTVFLEIGSRPAGNPNPLTVLNPRQQVTSAPYAVQSLNATDSDNLGGVAANQYVQTSDSRLTNARDPLAGSFSYIQNTNSTQPFASFNVSGNGTVGAILSGNVVNTATQYNINGNRFLSIGGLNNTIAGIGAGSVNSGSGNAFFGTNAGNLNTNGGGNSFYGNAAGASNTSSSFNSFFGTGAGFLNNAGDSNSFFGFAAGNKNSSGTGNSFFGSNAGNANTTASSNSFFGQSAGKLNTASGNSFFGNSAGGLNSTGTRNSFYGESSGAANTTASDNTFFGSTSGSQNTTGIRNTFIGSKAGTSNLDESNNTIVGFQTGAGGSENTVIGSNSGAAGDDNTTIGYLSFANGTSNTAIGHNASVNKSGGANHSTAIGADSVVTTNNTIMLGRPADTVVAPNLIQVNSLGAAGSTSLCRNASNQISTCTAGNLAQGDTAISAEIVILRSQLALQTEQNKQQQLQIDSLRKLICAQNQRAEVCKELK